ncbi:hypothetical protein SNARM312S_02981 [Streptomyces narbonensis]
MGEFVGTLDYVAPEQISGKPVDGRCDVYSLACVVFETLVGAPPFRRETDWAVLWAQQYDPPPPLSEVRPGLPEAADSVFARALAKSPEERYGTCLEFVAALRSALAGAGTGGEVVTTGTRPPGPPPAPPAWARPVFREL